MTLTREVKGKKRLLPLTCLAAIMSHCTFMGNLEGLHQCTEVLQWQECPCLASGVCLGHKSCTAQCCDLAALGSAWWSCHGIA